MEKKINEKKLEKMKLSELYEMKHIVTEYSEEHARYVSSYRTNGMMDSMMKLSPTEQIHIDKKIKADKLINKINALIEDKLYLYFIEEKIDE